MASILLELTAADRLVAIDDLNQQPLTVQPHIVCACPYLSSDYPNPDPDRNLTADPELDPDLIVGPDLTVGPGRDCWHLEAKPTARAAEACNATPTTSLDTHTAPLEA